MNKILLTVNFFKILNDVSNIHKNFGGVNKFFGYLAKLLNIWSKLFGILHLSPNFW